MTDRLALGALLFDLDGTLIDIDKDPLANRAIVTIADPNGDLWTKGYDGTTWTNLEGGSALELNLSNTSGVPFDFSYDRLADSIPPITTASTTTGTPDGNNGWFKTPTTITLARNEPGTTYYKWDSDPSYSTYSSALSVPDGIHSKQDIHQRKHSGYKSRLRFGSPEPVLQLSRVDPRGSRR